jgi:RNA polymerase sigma-70 factor (ECF subfamily)
MSYREPILRYINRAIRTDVSHRYGGRDAEDLTHDFLVRLLEGGLFAHLSQREGRFRTYLLGAIRHFLSEIRRQESAIKRGGGLVHLPIHDNILQSEEETMFDRDWAGATINRAVALLGDTRETQMLLPWITCEMPAEDRERLAAELGKSESAIKIALHRLRKKFREHTLELIAQTVEYEAEIGSELDYLIRVLSQR